MGLPMRGTRIDKLLVDRGLVESREKAQRLIMAGKVRAGDRVFAKPSESVDDAAGIEVEVVGDEKFVSRGGYKIEKALDEFNVRTDGITAIDAGASTGGFTDCLLQRGAARVYAVDVGQGQLAWKLRQDPRVIVREKLNARNMSARQLDADFQPVDLIVVDCSFISLRSILPNLALFLRPGGSLLALIKPQFEAGKQEVDRGRGVIRDPAVHQSVIDGLRDFVNTGGFLDWHGCVESPILGPSGNREFLACLKKRESGH